VLENVTLVSLSAFILAIAAGVTDLCSRRIPNRLVLAGFVLGLAFNTRAGGVAGLGWSLAGAGLGLALFLPFFLLGGMGGGDVKLMAALGSLLGPADISRVAVAAAFAGGLLALMVAWWSGRLLATLSGVTGLLMFWWSAGLRPSPELSLAERTSLRLPYAIPIATGTILVALGRWS
jgi:prepilin peptidase CpaA